MKGHRSNILTLIVTVAAVALFRGGFAQEHPKEHPKGGEHPKKEHPESGKTLSADDLAAAAENWIKSESAKTGGKLEVNDPVQNRTLRLTLDRVHRERVSTVAPETHFVCADFREDDGHLYDIDIFLKGPDKDHLTATEVSVHKVDGKERYTWYEEGGIWKKRPVS